MFFSKRNLLNDELKVRELIGSLNDLDVFEIITKRLCVDDEMDLKLKNILIDFHSDLVDFFLEYEIKKNEKN